MNFDELVQVASDFVMKCPANRVTAENAIRPELVGMPMFDMPIFGVGAADDPLFEQLKEPEVVGEGAFLPTDWLPEGKSVISFFLPFSEIVRSSNRLDPSVVSDEWLHARIEGQTMVNQFGAFLCEQLKKQGFEAVYPAADSRFKMLAPFASNWSERHVAYICGLGTFGLSKGLITTKGIAGRFGSVITSASLPATQREYSNPFEYCTMCGKCAINCPAHAIDTLKGVINGKSHDLCSAFLKKTTKPPHGPKCIVRYGCGKCQVNVPCEHCIP